MPLAKAAVVRLLYGVKKREIKTGNGNIAASPSALRSSGLLTQTYPRFVNVRICASVWHLRASDAKDEVSATVFKSRS